MKMNKNHKTVLVILNIIVSFLISSCSSPKEQVRIGNGTFTIEGKDIQLICGEMHYPRIPHEYWRDRLKRARAMGLNTVSAYVFWNFHERQPGEFDFSGQADIAEFIRTAQEEGLYVILRPGPYVCAEWDFGGYPSWLLKEKDMTYRSKDPRFLSYCERYIKELGKQLNDMLNDLQNQYFKGVGTSKIFDPTFLFDIDPVRNKPIFFKHPQTSCLFLYSNPEDVPNFIRLLSLELRVKLNPFSLVITVIDMKNMGQDYVYFTSDDSEDLPGGTKSVFSIVALEEDLKNSMNKLSTDLLRRQSNIRREFTTIKVYNERMIELKSLTESYHFMFVIDPETNYLTNSDVTKALRVGGDLGVFLHLFINKEEFKGLGDTAVSILDAIGRVYYLEDGKLFERAKDFVVENLLSDNS